MKWATRARCKIDRTACAWLIQRFIDPQAEFMFVEDPADVPSDATPFDIAGVAFGHHDGRSSFEVMVDHYRLDAPGLARLAQVIHEADIEDEVYDAPEAAGVNAVIRGLGKLLGNDARLLEQTRPVYDALLEEFAATSPS